MNKIPSEKYGIKPDKVEKESLSSEPFRIKSDLHRLEKVIKNVDRLNKYKRKVDSKKNIKLRENLELGEQVLVFTERLKKKYEPGKFYKISTQNKSYFNKDKVFVVMKNQKIGNQYFYWLTNTKTK